MKNAIKKYFKRLIYCFSTQTDFESAMEYCDEQYWYYLGKNLQNN